MNEADLTYTTQFFQKNINTEQYDQFVLGADVGGTTTNVAVAGVNNDNVSLLFSLDFDTKMLPSFLPALNKTLSFAKDNFDIQTTIGCIGAAGIVSADLSFVDLTNIPWNIYANDLMKKSSMTSLFFLNDFQVLGYGLNMIDLRDESEIIPVRKTEYVNTKKPRILLGAGTGLGKTVLRYDVKNQLYHAYASEGGHVDIPVYTEFELDLINFVRKKKHPDHPVSYEDVLSGNGLIDIYTFLRKINMFEETEYTEIIDQTIEKDKPSILSKYRSDDEYCRETFRLFRRFFARCAKNLALDTLSLGGVFIAGGIAGKNQEIFLSNEFKTEFNQNFRQSDFLQKIPLYLLSNYYLSIQGACFAATKTDSILDNQKSDFKR